MTLEEHFLGQTILDRNGEIERLRGELKGAYGVIRRLCDALEEAADYVTDDRVRLGFYNLAKEAREAVK